MTENAPKAAGSLFITGIVMIAISTGIYCFHTRMNSDESMGLFALNYLATITYFAMIWWYRQWQHMFSFLVLFLISAYSLNHGIPVFERSANWLTVALIICSANLVFLPYIDRAPVVIQRLMSVLTGFSLALFIYLTIYLLPLYPFGAMAFFALGISLHAFVPLLIVIFLIRQVARMVGSDIKYGWGIASGFVASLLVVFVFTVQWNQVNKLVSRDFNKTLYADNTELPGWIKVAQNLPDNFITEKYLKGNLVYTMPEFDRQSDFFNFGFPHKNFEEERKHDPLIMVAGFFAKPPALDADDRIKILESIYVSRHRTQERLWNGENLHTRNIISNIRIWPEQRIAYTEKTITVENEKDYYGWWNREEAIYTFHLPEGGVVTSLSLWIDGKEQKGVLTTRGKADSAYKQIVGVEQHDPSLVKWQEGNTVTVRIFPVRSSEKRIFKIGITAPLTSTDHQLMYENIWFEGPGMTDATETRQVDWVSEPKGFTMPEGFTQNGKHRYIKESDYDPGFQLVFNDPGLKPEGFSFDGNCYSVQAYARQRQPAVFKRVYLDINSAWTRQDVDRIYDIVKDKEVYVYNDEMIQLDGNNHKIVDQLLSQRFSLFPFQEAGDASTALVITKCSKNSPNLGDIKGSDFADSLEKKIATAGRIKLFNLGYTVSPYLKGLKEHRTFEYEEGDADLLKQLVSANTFAHSIEDDDHIVIDNANLLLTRSKDSVAHSGPDHLMRLFAYNHLMSQLKSKLFTKAEGDSVLVDEAEEANIVTPLSSLIVLESQHDYDRFNIVKKQTTLDNASLKSTGAVPEPHEWALIIIACLALMFLKYKEQFQKWGLNRR